MLPRYPPWTGLACRYKGTIPYVKKPKAKKSKKKKAKSGPAGLPWGTVVPAAAVAVSAIVGFFVWQHAAVLQARLPEVWYDMAANSRC